MCFVTLFPVCCKIYWGRIWVVYSSRLYIYGSYIPFNIHVSIPALNTPTKSRFLRIFDHQKSLQGLTSDSSTPMFSLEPTPFCSRRTWMKRRVFGKNFEVKMKVTKRSLKKKSINWCGISWVGWELAALPSWMFSSPRGDQNCSVKYGNLLPSQGDADFPCRVDLP